MKKALITGITGQDGAYLAEFLLNKGYEVHGLKRRSSLLNTDRIDHLYQDPHERGIKFHLHYSDMTDSVNIIRLVKEIEPDEIYNLAAMSHVQVSFQIPEYTANTAALGVLRILEAIRILNLIDKTKIYQASSSELFGKAQEFPQTEKTPFYPRSPYAVSKLYAYWIIVNYREAYNIFASNGILFNHESPVRGETFVTRKITRAIAGIVLGLQNKFYLGNLDAKRDWGHTKDYVEAMWKILQYKNPDDFIIATGIATSVRDFVRQTFETIGISLKFEGTGINEKGIIADINYAQLKNYGIIDSHLKKGDIVLEVDKRYFRPTEVDYLVGDATKAKEKLNWKPKYDLNMLIKDMISSDIELMKRDKFLLKSGYKIRRYFE